jgi:glutamate dehydrogenase (NAD(P)+)
LRPGDERLPRDEWMSIETDILVPAAVADAITAENVDRVSARLVVEAANIPTTGEAEARLCERGVLVIPDFVANGGTNAWFWWILLGLIESSPESAFARIAETMRFTVAAVLARADRERLTPRGAAELTAIRNLDELARQYGEESPLAGRGY